MNLTCLAMIPALTTFDFALVAPNLQTTVSVTDFQTCTKGSLISWLMYPLQF